MTKKRCHLDRGTRENYSLERSEKIFNALHPDLAGGNIARQRFLVPRNDTAVNFSMSTCYKPNISFQPYALGF